MGWWPFGNKTYLDPEDEQWQVETWRWFALEFGPVERIALVTPTDAFFPPIVDTGAQRVLHIFDCVKRHAGMADWHCRLIAQPRRAPLAVGRAVLEPITQAPAGTFAFDENEAVISFDPELAFDPMKLIATFIHELAHYRLAAIKREAPGGEAVHEYTTDLMTVYLGFGLFGADSAFNFNQFQSGQSFGWKWSRHGYLGERGMVFALAVFLELKGRDSNEVRLFLKPHLYSQLKKVRRYLKKRGVLSSA